MKIIMKQILVKYLHCKKSSRQTIQIKVSTELRPVSMKSLILISIFVAAVKSREVHDSQGQIVNEAYTENGCLDTEPYYTSQLTVTTTNIWLNTVKIPSLVLGSTRFSIFVTTTDYAVETITDYEVPLTITTLPVIDSIWKTATKTWTEVTQDTHINVVAVTDTSTLYAEAIDVSVTCITYYVDGNTHYKTSTTYWTHTQTLHDKVMVGTELDVTVTSTYLVSSIEAAAYTEYITRTETHTSTEFYTRYHDISSTLWVTHAVKTDCPTDTPIYENPFW